MAKPQEEKKSSPLFTIYPSMVCTLAIGQPWNVTSSCQVCRKKNGLLELMFDAWVSAREQLREKYPDKHWNLNSITFREGGTTEIDYEIDDGQSADSEPTRARIPRSEVLLAK